MGVLRHIRRTTIQRGKNRRSALWEEQNRLRAAEQSAKLAALTAKIEEALKDE
jgi:hypothetical protein